VSRSILLQLSRNSIEEVLQTQHIIDKKTFLENYPLLNEKIATRVNIYLENELRGFYECSSGLSLFEAITVAAKKAAFEDANSSPLTISEYLRCEIELILETNEGIISEKDAPLLKS